MGKRIVGNFEGPLLPIPMNAKVQCHTCTNGWTRRDLYSIIKAKILAHLNANPTHILTTTLDDGTQKEWKMDQKPFEKGKIPF